MHCPLPGKAEPLRCVSFHHLALCLGESSAEVLTAEVFLGGQYGVVVVGGVQ